MSCQLCLLSSSPTFFLLYVLQFKYCVSPFCLKYCFLLQLISLWGLLLAPSYLPINISCVVTHTQAALTVRTSPIFLVASKMFHTFQIVSPFLCVCFLSRSLQVLVEQATDRRLSEQDPSGFLWSCVADTGADAQRYSGRWESPPTGSWLLLPIVFSCELCCPPYKPVLWSDSRRLL